MTIGTLNVSGISLPIIDCKSWRVAGTSPFCTRNLDATKCDTCEQRETLNRLVPFGQKETSPPPEGNGEGEAK